MARFEISKHERNNTIQIPFPFKWQEYSSNPKLLLLVAYPISTPVLFDRFSTILDKIFVKYSTF